MKASRSAPEEGGLSSGWVNISGTASSKVAKSRSVILGARSVRRACPYRLRRTLAGTEVGGGKTIVFTAITASAHSRGKRVLVAAHSRELIRQASAKLTAAGVPHGIIAPGHAETADQVQVGSIQTGHGVASVGLRPACAPPHQRHHTITTGRGFT